MHITLYFAVIRFHNPTLDYKSYSKYITKDFGNFDHNTYQYFIQK